LCFLLPVLTAAYTSDRTSLILYPTKALAQDQFSKLQALLQTDNNADLAERIRPATLDGDCPHSKRVDIAERANVILTNPDTLHAAILPAWRTMYGSMLARLKFIVIDEAHYYEGIFGAHVAMILSRLMRVSQAAASRYNQGLFGDNNDESRSSLPIFVAASATLPWPEQHFRRLCPISPKATVRVLSAKEDGSPRSEKHFFVWNPPILNSNGTCTGIVTFPRPKKAPPGDKTFSVGGGISSISSIGAVGKKRPRDESPGNNGRVVPVASLATTVSAPGNDQPAVARGKRTKARQKHGEVKFHRRHSADETALLLARAVVSGIRCIAFCKTRNLVEWVYERALTCLGNDPRTAHLTSKVESYRGGYSMIERRQIEKRLFQNELLGVVGTNALELGVDIGGIDLTLHCGYPSSYASLLQQAGRAGRGGARLDVPSCAVVVCFNSPSEQHIWRHPKSLLACGVSAPNTIPINSGLVQGHLLCASEEYPLTGAYPITIIQQARESDQERGALLNDHALFGGKDIYDEALEVLRSTGSVMAETIAALGSTMTLFKAHPSMHKAWSRISIRSIEPVSYAVVDVSHPGQGGKMDSIRDERAVMDTLPYSRVFYHAHPGAIITHRGKKYKVISMTRPPASVTDSFGGRNSLKLAAFAKPTMDKYATRPLSNLDITVVKQMERAEIRGPNALSKCELGTGTDVTVDESALPVVGGEINYNFAGCGQVTVKRSVTGYQKLSLITRAELSRSELSLPELEFDTFGLWIDTEAGVMTSVLGDSYGPGVHALSHALLAVAPLFAPGLVRSDLECDHSIYGNTQVMLFDERAGGSGSSERLWKSLFYPNSILEAAVELLEECSSCCLDSGYDGGCPACLHASSCTKFNMHLSRSAGAVIGKRIIQRIQETDLYKQFASTVTDESSAQEGDGQPHSTQPEKPMTPRRKARSKALRSAKEMRSARDRQFVVGRPSWPLDGDETGFRQVDG
jgi:DEAD/DEAH box helicase domain-containing protein